VRLGPLSFGQVGDFFLNLTFDPFGLDVQPQTIVDAHILVRDPNQREQRDEIPAPIGIQQFEASDDQKERRDVMTEAVLAGKEIEEFSFVPAAAIAAATLAVLAWLTKDLFMRDRPRDARDGYRDHEEVEQLSCRRRHALDCSRR
jgi:hypothetical protein